jgi:hypothetical protein
LELGVTSSSSCKNFEGAAVAHSPNKLQFCIVACPDARQAQIGLAAVLASIAAAAGIFISIVKEVKAFSERTEKQISEIAKALKEFEVERRKAAIYTNRPIGNCFWMPGTRCPALVRKVG